MKTRSRTPVAALTLAAALVLSACASEETGGSPPAAGGEEGAEGKIAFLMPDIASTRYELHDRPLFEAKVKELCPGCEVVYANADADAAKQQQQANSALAQGVKAIVLDPVDSDGRRDASSTPPRRRACRSSPTTARSPTRPPTTTSPSTTRRSAR